MKRKTAITIVAFCVITLLIVSSTDSANSLSNESENPISGAYIDKVVYDVITDPNLMNFDLQAGDIQSYIGYLNPDNLELFESDPDIEIYTAPQNMYAQLLINCRDYPLNISGLRRAFAYAFDKTRVPVEILDGHGFEHDSVVPKPSIWCAEDDLPWQYYNNQSDLGNQILDSLNFIINEGTGYRRAPNGNPFSVVIEVPMGFDAGMECAQIGVEALESLHIDADSSWTNTGDLVSRLDNHGSYDMAIFSRSFSREMSIEWMESSFGSEYATVAFANPSNFVNETFDLWSEQFIKSTSYEEAFEASTKMQTILHENVPVLILYEPFEYQAYRTDVFTGYIEDTVWGIAGPWTNLKVHYKTGSPFGGTFDIGLASNLDSFNIFNYPSDIEELILTNLYSSLYRTGPDQVQYPDLSEHTLIETHQSNQSVPEGHTQITVDIKSNAKWSDGMPLTAEDVAFTFTYLYESAIYGNPLGLKMPDLVSSNALSSYSVRMEFNTESYLDIMRVLTTKIIPMHVFNDETGIGYDGWSSWNPVFGLGPHVTCGPFFLSDYDTYAYELSRNLDYHWLSGSPPKVLSAEDITYIEGTTGNQIVWEVEDEDPFDYVILQNNSLVLAEAWNGSDVIHNVDGLSVGTYNYTLTLSDSSGYWVTSTVWVTVTPRESSEQLDLLTLGIAAGSIVIIISVGVVIYKKR